MDWSEGDEWKVSAEVAPGDELEYKYVVLGPSGIVEWQTGSNRRLAVDVPGGAAVTVVDEWHGPTQQVSVELPEALQATSPSYDAAPESKRAPIGFFGKHRLPASLQRSFAGTQAAKAESASKDLSKKQLKSLLEKKGLSTEGRKIDLLERLRSAA
ncbi:hypothetical protein ACKKBG_A34700 [Auxenochlorella protothecoides x Auxenochlorella symbiontica]